MSIGLYERGKQRITHLTKKKKKKNFTRRK